MVLSRLTAASSMQAANAATGRSRWLSVGGLDYMVISPRCDHPFMEIEVTPKTTILAARLKAHLALDRTDEVGGATFSLTFPR